MFARQDIAAGVLLERSPVIVIPRADVFAGAIDSPVCTAISFYVFNWEQISGRKDVALALGYGSIFNHSYSPNAKFTFVAPDLIDFHAIYPIEAGREILVNYWPVNDPNTRSIKDAEDKGSLAVD